MPKANEFFLPWYQSVGGRRWGGVSPRSGLHPRRSANPLTTSPFVVILLSVFFGNGSIADSFALVFSGVGNVHLSEHARFDRYPTPWCVYRTGYPAMYYGRTGV